MAGTRRNVILVQCWCCAEGQRNTRQISPYPEAQRNEQMYVGHQVLPVTLALVCTGEMFSRLL